MTLREELLQYARDEYGDEAQYLWESVPDGCVLRHANNRKWYALFMTLPRQRLGLFGEGACEILDVKASPEEIGSLLEKDGFRPAYHMNKSHWVTILLDGAVSFAQCRYFLAQSYALTANRK